MDAFFGWRERFIEKESAPMREIYEHIQLDALYRPDKTTRDEQQRFVDAYRANWSSVKRAESQTAPHFPSFRAASMIEPKGNRLYLIPQVRYMPTVQHTHDYYEFGILLDGACRHFVQDICLDLRAGDVVLIPPGTKHQPVMLTDSCIWYDLGVRADQITDVIPHLWHEDCPLMNFMRTTRDVVSTNAYGLIHMDPVELARGVQLLSETQLGRDDILLRRREELLAELLIADLARCTNVHTVEDAPELLKSDDSIIRYINGNFRTLTRKDLAEHFAYSERQITRIVFKQTGQTLQEYLCNVRMSYIENMLEFTVAPVHEIIESAGYHNNNNFFNLFRERYHMTPGEYRKIKQDQAV